jgi:hypothetical protein
MTRKVLCAAVVLVFGFSVARAEVLRGSIKKIEDGKITFATYDRATKKAGEDKTYAVAKDAKVLKGKFNKEDKKVEAGDALSDGLQNKVFQSIGKRGVRAQITTNDAGEVTQILVFPQFRKKKKSNNVN